MEAVMKNQDKQKKEEKKKPQRTLKEKHAENWLPSLRFPAGRRGMNEL
jgi:hypothetical protein